MCERNGENMERVGVGVKEDGGDIGVGVGGRRFFCCWKARLGFCLRCCNAIKRIIRMDTTGLVIMGGILGISLRRGRMVEVSLMWWSNEMVRVAVWRCYQAQYGVRYVVVWVICHY